MLDPYLFLSIHRNGGVSALSNYTNHHDGMFKRKQCTNVQCAWTEYYPVFSIDVHEICDTSTKSSVPSMFKHSKRFPEPVNVRHSNITVVCIKVEWFLLFEFSIRRDTYGIASLFGCLFRPMDVVYNLKYLRSMTVALYMWSWIVFLVVCVCVCVVCCSFFVPVSQQCQ